MTARAGRRTSRERHLPRLKRWASGRLPRWARDIANESLECYDAGLKRLSAGDRDVIVARLELGLSYGEIAERYGKPTRRRRPDGGRPRIERLTAAMNTH